MTIATAIIVLLPFLFLAALLSGNVGVAAMIAVAVVLAVRFVRMVVELAVVLVAGVFSAGVWLLVMVRQARAAGTL